jgi:hypothetical protein
LTGEKNTREILLAEEKMKSKEVTMTIKCQFVAKKAGGNFGRLSLANSVTLATRVRIDILRAMAKQ